MQKELYFSIWNIHLLFFIGSFVILWGHLFARCVYWVRCFFYIFKWPTNWSIEYLNLLLIQLNRTIFFGCISGIGSEYPWQHEIHLNWKWKELSTYTLYSFSNQKCVSSMQSPSVLHIHCNCFKCCFWKILTLIPSTRISFRV